MYFSGKKGGGQLTSHYCSRFPIFCMFITMSDFHFFFKSILSLDFMTTVCVYKICSQLYQKYWNILRKHEIFQLYWMYTSLTNNFESNNRWEKGGGISENGEVTVYNRLFFSVEKKNCHFPNSSPWPIVNVLLAKLEKSFQVQAGKIYPYCRFFLFWWLLFPIFITILNSFSIQGSKRSILERKKCTLSWNGLCQKVHW